MPQPRERYLSSVGAWQTFERLSEAVLAVNRHLSVKDVLQTIVAAARELLDCEYSALGVPDDQGGFAEFVVAGVSDEQWDAIGPLPRQHGLLGVMLREAKPQRIDDVGKDLRFGWWPKAHPVLADFLGMPIMNGDQILGSIYLANSRNGRFTDGDEQLLGVLAAHAAIAITNARLYERSRELILLEERHRVARELHDAVAQKLFSLRLTVEAAATVVERDPRRAAVSLDEVRRLAAQAAEELSQVVAELRPRELADAGLVETLRRRVALLDRVHTTSVRLNVSVQPRLSYLAEEMMLRIVEEALHNALRHAEAAHITVSLRATADGEVECQIDDDGVGFDASRGSGLGLMSMRERARKAGGSLTVVSHPGTGTTLTVVVPHG